jgi:hypothetical protein
LFVLLGGLIAPRAAEARLTASEAAAFYQTFLVEPPRTCGDLRAYGGEKPKVTQELCAGAVDSAPANLVQHLRDVMRQLDEGRNPKLVKRALINGGGVSMGSYQAGRLQGIINDARFAALDKVFDAAALATAPSELAKVDDQLNDVLAGTEWANLGFEQLAGASAGGMNAVGFAIELCRNTLLPTFAPETTGTEFLQPTDSVLRRMWLDVGFEKSDQCSWAAGKALLRDRDLPADAPRADKNAVFSAEPLNNVIAAVEKFFSPSPPVALRAGCGMGVSITVTSLSPVEVGLQNGQKGSFLSVTVPVMVELKMSSTWPYHLQVHPYTPAGGSVMSVDRDAKALLALVRATGALPPALPMVSLCEAVDTGSISFGGTKYAVGECQQGGEGDGEQQKEGNVQRARRTKKAPREMNLIDGGLFNNNPLDLVLDRASNHGISEFLFFDQDFTAIPRPTARARYKGTTLYVQFQRLMSAAMLDVARSQQVASALRRFPERSPGGGTPDKPQVVSIGRDSPALSEAGFATSAFLLREFRELDYLAGMLDAQSSDHPSWISGTADIATLRDFYNAPLSSTLSDGELVCQIRACLERKSGLAPGQQAWGRRCLLAGAARKAVQTIKEICGADPTSPECEQASEFSALGFAAKVLEDAALEGRTSDGKEVQCTASRGTGAEAKGFQFITAIRDDIQEQLALLSDRIDEMVQNQRSVLALSSRALDIGMERVFIDGLQFLPNIYSDEKDLRVIRGRWNPQAGGLVTDLRFVVDRSFWAIEGSRRFIPDVASAQEVAGWEVGIGFVPAISLGAGLGCSDDGHLTWFRCESRPEPLDDGTFELSAARHFLMAYGDVSAELVVVNNPAVSLRLGPLLTARSGYVFDSDSQLGFGLEVGGFMRVGLVRTISLDFRVVSGLQALRAGADIAKPVGKADFIFAVGWQF